MRCVTRSCWLAAALHWGTAHGAVEAYVGPTRIPDGEARAARDITLSNEHLAVAIAVESPAPYGVPRGAIVDVAPVVNGQPQRDRVVFADFIPNNWSAWPNTYQKVEIVERGPTQAVVRAVRDWGKVTLTTTYTLRAGADRLELRTTMTNTGESALTDLLSGQTLWPSAGYYFPIPGLAQLPEGKASGALADRAVAYDEDWFIALHAPYMDSVGSTSKDLFLKHTLRPGESRSFDAWLQVGARGDLAPVVASEIERRQLAAGTLQGAVTSRDGQPVANPVVVIARQGKPYAWTLGRDGQYAVKLPAGDYSAYATAKGYSQSPSTPITVTGGGQISRDFRSLDPPGRVEFAVTDSRDAQPLDARISIREGQRQEVEFLGRNTYFTELERRGRYDVALAPGRYAFKVTSGGGFLAAGQDVRVEVRSGRTAPVEVSITPRFEPAAEGWYSADLHHHADQAEGVTPPEDLARSQLAAGLDLLFVSDHDSTANHAVLQRIADRRGLPFIPSMEISPSWGHFNAWPLTPGLPLAIDTSTATIDQVLGEARRQGAIVVQSNHPFIPYGYLSSVSAGVAPGGFNPAFDLVEINGANADDDTQVLHTLWDFWNAGHRYYLSAGTDVHDVWNHESGAVRLFAQVSGKLTASAYAQAAHDGHAYVSYGPLITPSVMFGSELKLRPRAAFSLGFRLRSVNGLKQATLVSGGRVIANRALDDRLQEANVDFALTADRSTWYAIEVEDKAGRKAYSNPIWIDVIAYPAPASPK